MSDGKTTDGKLVLDARATIPRRTLLKAGGAAVAASSMFSMPYFFSRTSAQSQPLVFWEFHSGENEEGQIEPTAQWFRDTAQAWNDQNETKIQLQDIPGSPEEYYNKLSTAFAAGEGQDLFLLSPSDWLRYQNSNTLLDLTPFMEQPAIEDFYPSVMATRMEGDKIYGLPMEVDPVAMYYSAKAFEEAGLSEADIPQTWSSCWRWARALLGRPLRPAVRNPARRLSGLHLVPVPLDGRGDVVTEDGKHSKFNHPGTIRALQLWKDAVEREIAPRELLGGGAWNISANLVEGYTAIQQCGIWGISGLRDDASDFEYGSSSCPRRPRASTSASAVVGPGSPAPRARTRRRRRSSSSGPSAR